MNNTQTIAMLRTIILNMYLSKLHSQMQTYIYFYKICTVVHDLHLIWDNIKTMFTRVKIF